MLSEISHPQEDKHLTFSVLRFKKKKKHMEGEDGLLTKEESRQKAALDSDGVDMIKTV